MRRVSLCLFAAALFAAGPALAVAGGPFELDGNIKKTTQNGVDWADLFDSNYPSIGATAKPDAQLPAGFSSPTFVPDFVSNANGPDATTFTQGSKDVNNIPTWVCATAQNTGDKVDIVNIYAVAYRNSANEDIFYFAMERFANEGDANLGFWFLKDGTVNCLSPDDFGGEHQDGDLLIVAEVTSGGDVPTIKAYKWERSGSVNALNTTPVAAGSLCTGANVDACGITNGSVVLDGDGTADVPWLSEHKAPGNTPSHDIDLVQFFEAGINVTRAGASGCFSKVLGDTRQSPGPGKEEDTSLSAALADYALGEFNQCSISVTKSCTCEQILDDPNDPDQTNVLFRQVVDATIENTGGGAIEKDKITCTDTLSPAGSPASLSFIIPVGLAGKGTKTKLSDHFTAAQRSMLTKLNAPTNSITCQASAFGATFGDSDTGVQCGQCASEAGLFLEKTCRTKLDSVSGLTVVRVLFDGRVCNTGKVPALASNIMETHVGGSQNFPNAFLDAGVLCDSNADCPVTTPVTECAGGDLTTPAKKDGVCTKGGGEGFFFGGNVCTSVSGNYLPGSANNGEMCPSNAMFSDDLKATLSYDADIPLSPVSGTTSANCKLCPVNGVCPAP